MGRYVTGDFDWKFAFGDQSSTFGEVLENICTDLDEIWLNRYVGTQGEGEKVELRIDGEDGLKALKVKIAEFIGKDFAIKGTEKWGKCKERFGDDYWDKVMMRKFLKKINEGEIIVDDTYYFEVEY